MDADFAILFVVIFFILIFTLVIFGIVFRIMSSLFNHKQHNNDIKKIEELQRETAKLKAKANKLLKRLN